MKYLVLAFLTLLSSPLAQADCRTRWTEDCFETVTREALGTDEYIVVTSDNAEEWAAIRPLRDGDLLSGVRIVAFHLSYRKLIQTLAPTDFTLHELQKLFEDNRGEYQRKMTGIYVGTVGAVILAAVGVQWYATLMGAASGSFFVKLGIVGGVGFLSARGLTALIDPSGAHVRFEVSDPSRFEKGRNLTTAEMGVRNVEEYARVVRDLRAAADAQLAAANAPN